MSDEKKSCDKQTAFGRQIDEIFDSIPFYKWWEHDRKTQRFDPLPIAEEAWNVSEKQTRLAVLTELEREVEARMKQGRRRASMGDGRLSQIALIEAREDENILAIIRSKKGGA